MIDVEKMFERHPEIGRQATTATFTMIEWCYIKAACVVMSDTSKPGTKLHERLTTIAKSIDEQIIPGSDGLRVIK